MSIEHTLERNLRAYICGQAIFCKGCDNILDVDKRPGFEIIASVNGIKTGQVTLCQACLDKRGGQSAILSSVKRAHFKANPKRIDGDGFADNQEWLPGTKPDLSTVDRVTVEII